MGLAGLTLDLESLAADSRVCIATKHASNGGLSLQDDGQRSLMDG